MKVTFAHGAKFADPDKLFNAGLGGNMRREIDFLEGDKVDERALKNLVRTAIEYNQAHLKKNASAAKRAKVAKKAVKQAPEKAVKKTARKTTKRKKA